MPEVRPALVQGNGPTASRMYFPQALTSARVAVTREAASPRASKTFTVSLLFLLGRTIVLATQLIHGMALLADVLPSQRRNPCQWVSWRSFLLLQRLLDPGCARANSTARHMPFNHTTAPRLGWRALLQSSAAQTTTSQLPPSGQTDGPATPPTLGISLSTVKCGAPRSQPRLSCCHPRGRQAWESQSGLAVPGVCLRHLACQRHMPVGSHKLLPLQVPAARSAGRPRRPRSPTNSATKSAMASAAWLPQPRRRGAPARPWRPWPAPCASCCRARCAVRRRLARRGGPRRGALPWGP
mmetsp:Transcript_41327/g.131460  ORF Transcript_41327/g.131460 Transcript_41327/m.131460 type:complete len:297 (+) Transcript_41327:1171-2061(+)